MGKVMQLDYDTGELIEIYDSVRLAANDNYISYISLREALQRGNGTAKLENKKLVFTREYTPRSF